jgi:hypothetical protein
MSLSGLYYWSVWKIAGIARQLALNVHNMELKKNMSVMAGLENREYGREDPLC